MNNVADHQLVIISSGLCTAMLKSLLERKGTVAVVERSAISNTSLAPAAHIFYEYPEFSIPSFMELKELAEAHPGTPFTLVLPTTGTGIEQMMQLLHMNHFVYADDLAQLTSDEYQTPKIRPARRDLENEMMRIKSNLQKLIDNVDNLVWSVDSELKIIICNKAYSQFVNEKVGIMPTEGTLVLYHVFDNDFAALRRSQYLKALSGEHFTSVDRLTINGRSHFVETSFAPIVSEDGRVTGVCCHSNDLTEQVLRMEMIEEQNKALREIAFMQSHHVRAPLAKIMALSELFEYDVAYHEELQIISNIKYAATELDAVIRAIVDKTATIA